MKLILCTAAVCVSLLASVVSLSDLARTEGKKTRLSIPKALTEPLNPSVREESVVQKLDAISAQLISLNRRLSLLEESAGHPARSATSTDAATDAPTQADFRALATSVSSLSTSLARLEGVPSHLAALTTYLDRSFEHLEKTVNETAAPQDLLAPLNQLSTKLDNIDNYFTPLYTFLGLSYDPANQDLIAAYPSIDERLNDLARQIDSTHQELSVFHRMMTPVVIEPTHRP